MRSFASSTSLWTLLVVAAVSYGQIQFPTSGGGARPQRPPTRPQSTRPQSPRPLPPKSQSQTELSGCNCLPKSKCNPGFGQLGIICIAEGGGEGICCINQEGLTVVQTRLRPSSPITFPDEVISKGFENGQSSFKDLKQKEQTRYSNGDFLKKGDPARGHAYFFERLPSAKKLNDIAYTLALSSQGIADLQSLTPEQSFSSLPEVRIRPQQMGFQCPMSQVPRCDPNSKYRTIDGSCNNLRNPLWGKSETGFTRLRPPLYDDGIMEPRIKSVDGRPLPNVREASNTILLDLDNPDGQHTLGVMQWAQFMDHDLALTPFEDMNGEAIQCCENGRIVSPMPRPCFPIIISQADGFYGSRNQRCINFVRSMLAPNDNCGLGPVEQMDVLTQFVDGSMIYGSTELEKNRVADLTTGFMRISNNNLPPTNATLDCAARSPASPCFVGGDSRISEQPALTTMHTVWVREHNRIATILKRLNPQWNPTKLFEETRRIVVAQVQHIAYSEWLPIIIGKSLMTKLGINTLQNGYRNGYDPSVDPRVASEFSTAGFRFGHSLVQGLFRLVTGSGRISTLRLRDVFNAPHLLQTNPELVEQFINSMTLQFIQTLDSLITQELSNHLFQTPSTNFGMDLMSLNLQRGRDHAISTYNEMRELFGIGRARSFVDLQSTTPPALIQRIQTVYRHVDDIDLFVGGMTERSTSDGVLGPTFSNIVGNQFKNAMYGDRFFYDNGGQTGSFTPAQLQELRKSSIAKIFCDNSNINDMQPLAFSSVGPNNPRVPCSQIPSINLDLFKE